MDIQKFIDEFNKTKRYCYAVIHESFALLFFDNYTIEIRTNTTISIKKKTDEQIRKEENLHLTLNRPIIEQSKKWERVFRISSERLFNKEVVEVLYFPHTEDVVTFSAKEFEHKSVDAIINEKIDKRFRNDLRNLISEIADSYLNSIQSLKNII